MLRRESEAILRVAGSEVLVAVDPTTLEPTVMVDRVELLAVDRVLRQAVGPAFGASRVPGKDSGGDGPLLAAFDFRAVRWPGRPGRVRGPGTRLPWMSAPAVASSPRGGCG